MKNIFNMIDKLFNRPLLSEIVHEFPIQWYQERVKKIDGNHKFKVFLNKHCDRDVALHEQKFLVEKSELKK